MAALLHDAGMLRMLQTKIPVQEHQIKGRTLSLQFVRALGLDAEVEDIIYHVYETWNGHGSPDELKGSHIPLGSRILAVAHSYTLLYDRYSHEASRGIRPREIHESSFPLESKKLRSGHH